MALALLWLHVGMLVACGRSPGKNAGEPLVDAGPEAAVVGPEAGVPVDAGDATIPPTATVYDICDTGFFQLPPGTDERRLRFWSLGERGVVYTRRASGVAPASLYLFDLETCTEYELLRDTQPWGAAIHGSDIFYVDDDVDPVYWRDNHLAHYDLDTWTSTPYFDSEFVTYPPKLGERYMLFSESITQWRDNQEIEKLVLHDRLLQTYEELTAPPEWPAEYLLTDRYALWMTRCEPDDPEAYACIRARDLQSGETRYLDTQDVGASFEAGGSWVTYLRTHPTLDSRLIVHNITTDATEILTVPLASYDYESWHAPVDDPLVVYATQAYSSSNGYYDFELFNAATGEQRLMTQAPCRKVWARAFHFPWVIFRIDPGDFEREYYLANLLQLGLVDQAGAIIPGANGVIDLPDVASP